MSDIGERPVPPAPVDSAGEDEAGTTLSLGPRGSSGAVRPQAPPLLDEPSGSSLETSRLPVVEREHYAVEGLFAQGGLGRILQARDLRLGRRVALKELRALRSEAESRFLTEALVTARLQHPSIIPVYEAGRWPGGEPFYAMRWVSGRSLAERMAQAPSLHERLALLPHVLSAADAVAYAHGQRIIHRDLKPANVLVGEFGETVVIDWGLAKDLSKAEVSQVVSSREPVIGPPSESDATLSGEVLGTPAYMPPEQAAGLGVDERADVYALGAMLYHLLAGVPPYGEGHAAEVMRRLLAGPSPTLELRQPGVPEELSAIVSKAMAREQAQRYPSARELAEDLRRFLTGQLVQAYRYSPAAHLRRFLRRYRAVVAVAAVALVVVAGQALVSVQGILAERDKAEAARLKETRRADELRLLEARHSAELVPNEALKLLAELSPLFDRWGAARVIAADAEAHGLATPLLGHTQAVSLALFSPEGRWVATVSDDRTVRLWDARTGRLRRLLGAHQGEVWHGAFSPDGRLLATCGLDGKLWLWDVEGTSHRVLEGHSGSSRYVQFSADGRYLFSSGWDGAVRRWSVASGQGLVLEHRPGHSPRFSLAKDGQWLVLSGLSEPFVRLWEVGKDDVRLRRTRQVPDQVDWLLVSPKGHLVAISGQSGRVWLWDVQSDELHALGSEHEQRLSPSHSYLTFSPEGRLLAARGTDGMVQVWEVATRRLLWSMPAQTTPSRFTLTFSPDSRWLAFVEAGRTVVLRDTATGESRRFQGSRDLVTSLAFSPDGSTLAVTRLEGAAWLFTVQGRAGPVIQAHQGKVLALAFSPEGRRLLSAGEDGVVRLWSPQGTEAPVELRGHQGPVQQALFSPDGRYVASSGREGMVRLWDRQGRALHVLQGHSGPVQALTFSPEGAWLASAGEDGTVRLWECSSGKGRVLGQHAQAVKGLAFSRDGRYVASGGGDGALWLWPVADRERGRLLHRERLALDAVAFSADGRWLAAGGMDHTLWLQDMETGESRRIDANGSITQVAFSRDGRRVLCTSRAGGSLRVWETSTGDRQEELRGHAHEIAHFTFSPEGLRVATASADGAVRLWDMEGGESRELKGHTGRVLAVAFSPDGKSLASAGEDGTVRLWNDDLPLDPQALRGWLKQQPALP